MKAVAQYFGTLILADSSGAIEISPLCHFCAEIFHKHTCRILNLMMGQVSKTSQSCKPFCETQFCHQRSTWQSSLSKRCIRKQKHSASVSTFALGHVSTTTEQLFRCPERLRVLPRILAISPRRNAGITCHWSTLHICVTDTQVLRSFHVLAT